MRKILTIISFSLCVASISAAQENMRIEIRPATVYIEQGEYKQAVNFDFLVTNTSNDSLRLDKITVTVFDASNKLILKRFLDNNGTAPSIFLLPERTWNGPITRLVFNPFSEFDLNTPLSKLEFEWVFTGKKDQEFTARSIIFPKKYRQPVAYNFPLKGRVLIYDAHDYMSHHRRFDYHFTPIRQLGFSANFMRYAYDMVVLDNANEQYKAGGKNNEDYFGFGATVYAVANGKVIYSSHDHKDDKNFNIPGLKDNPLELYGNCIAIQHADSAISVYGHLKENSVLVKKGDAVKTGQAIAQIGVSGSSFLPHLHFEVRNSLGHAAEGFPSRFSNIFLLQGNTQKKLISGHAETGNIIITK